MNREICFGRWQFCPDTHVVSKGGHCVHLEPRVSRLLEYFLANPDEVLSHERLVQAVWDDRVITDDAVRRAVSSLRRVLAACGLKGVIRTVPKKGYMAEFPAPEQEFDTRKMPAGAFAGCLFGNRRWTLHAVGYLLPVVTLLWWLSAWNSTPTDTSAVVGTPHRIAVLPFANLTPEAQTNDFSDGLADELISLLARYRTVRVTASRSSFQFRGGHPNFREAGERLGVQYLIEGTVRWEGEQVRVEAKLIDAEKGLQLWSSTRQRLRSDLLEAPRYIAREVAMVLHARHPGDEFAPPGDRGAVSLEARLEYLKGRQWMASWISDDFDAAITHFQRAIALDPEYAAAYAQLADALLRRVNAGAGGNSAWQVARSTAITLLEKASALDSALGETYIIRAGLYGEQPADIEADLRKGLALNPSYSRGYEKLAGLYANTNRMDEAFEMIDRAIALDPLWPRNRHFKAVLHLASGDLDKAEALEREVLRQEPRYFWALARLAWINWLRGNLAQAAALAESAVAADPRNEMMHDLRIYCYLALGEIELAQRLNHPATVVASLYVAQLSGNYRILDDHELFGDTGLLDAYAAPHYSDVLLRDSLTTGNFDNARTLLTLAYGFNGKSSSLDGDIRAVPAYMNMAVLWYAAGDESLLSPMIAGLRRRGQNSAAQQSPLDRLEFLQSEAVATAILGRNEEALDTLDEMLGSTPAIWWWVNSHPAFVDLRDEPALKARLSAGEEQARLQRALLDEMRRDGRIPDHL